jgi:hypothetical protein
MGQHGGAQATGDFGVPGGQPAGDLLEPPGRRRLQRDVEQQALAARLNATGKTPVIFCVLTDDTYQQSLDRCGGRLGNKGEEAAVAAVQMAAF